MGAIHAPAELALLARVLGGVVFASAIFGKLRDWQAFTGIVANYRLLPTGWAPTGSALVVAAEGFVVAAMAVGPLVPLGALAAIVLLLGFGGAMAINLARGLRDIDCGCFQGSARQPLSVPLVVRNGVLALLIVPALGGQAPLDQPLALIDGVLGGVAVAILNMVAGALIALREPAAAFRRRFA